MKINLCINVKEANHITKTLEKADPLEFQTKTTDLV